MRFQPYKILKRKSKNGDLSHSPTRVLKILSFKKSEYKIMYIVN